MVKGYARLIAPVLLGIGLAVPLPTPGPRLAAVQTQSAAQVRLYHVPIAVADLDKASRQFRALGFSLKPGQVHADGIRNFHAKFPDGTEIELISPPSRPRSALGEAYADYTRLGDGPAYLALYVKHMDQLAQSLKRFGSSYVRTANYLTMGTGAPHQYLFFAPGGLGAQLNRSGTDRKADFQHANGAQRLTAVWVASPDFEAEQRLLHSLGATFSETTVPVPHLVKASIAQLRASQLIYLPPLYRSNKRRVIVGITLAVGDLGVTERQLRNKRIPFVERQLQGRRSLLVDPAQASGTWVEFCETSGTLAANYSL